MAPTSDSENEEIRSFRPPSHNIHATLLARRGRRTCRADGCAAPLKGGWGTCLAHMPDRAPTPTGVEREAAAGDDETSGGAASRLCAAEGCGAKRVPGGWDACLAHMTSADRVRAACGMTPAGGGGAERGGSGKAGRRGGDSRHRVGAADDSAHRVGTARAAAPNREGVRKKRKSEGASVDISEGPRPGDRSGEGGAAPSNTEGLRGDRELEERRRPIGRSAADRAGTAGRGGDDDGVAPTREVGGEDGGAALGRDGPRGEGGSDDGRAAPNRGDHREERRGPGEGSDDVPWHAPGGPVGRISDETRPGDPGDDWAAPGREGRPRGERRGPGEEDEVVPWHAPGRLFSRRGRGSGGRGRAAPHREGPRGEERRGTREEDDVVPWHIPGWPVGRILDRLKLGDGGDGRAAPGRETEGLDPGHPARANFGAIGFGRPNATNPINQPQLIWTHHCQKLQQEQQTQGGLTQQRQIQMQQSQGPLQAPQQQAQAQAMQQQQQQRHQAMQQQQEQTQAQQAQTRAMQQQRQPSQAQQAQAQAMQQQQQQQQQAAYVAQREMQLQQATATAGGTGTDVGGCTNGHDGSTLISNEWNGEEQALQKQNASWEERYGQLKEYKDEHGTCRIPKGCPANPGLARWVQAQRRSNRNGDLSDDRAERLEEIGFCWKFGDHKRELWNERFEQLVKYKEENGHCDVPAGYSVTPGLGLWVESQRKFHKQKRLPNDHSERLERIGFRWEGDKIKPWDVRYEQLVKYKAEHGNCDVPWRHAANPTLALWVKEQRESNKAGELPDDRGERLEQIGFSWKTWGDLNRERWNERYAQLERYREEHGHCDVPRRYEVAPGLERWVCEQRHSRRNGRMSAERGERLDRIGFRWGADRNEGDGTSDRSGSEGSAEGAGAATDVPAPSLPKPKGRASERRFPEIVS